MHRRSGRCGPSGQTKRFIVGPLLNEGRSLGQNKRGSIISVLRPPEWAGFSIVCAETHFRSPPTSPRTGGPPDQARGHTPDLNCIESWDSRIWCGTVRMRGRPRWTSPGAVWRSPPSPILFGAHALKRIFGLKLALAVGSLCGKFAAGSTLIKKSKQDH